MTTVGLLCSRVRVEEKLLRDAVARCGVQVELVDERELVLELGDRGRSWDAVLQRSLSQTRGLALTRALESRDVPVVNTAAVVQCCNDKLATTTALIDAGVAVPRTVVATGLDAGLQAAERIGYPVVVKPLTGSWGRLVARLHDRDAAEAVFEDRAVLGSPEHSIFYVQEHIDKPGRDIRAFVVEGETICAVYRESAHWITNTARGAVTRNCPLTREIAELCCAAARAVGGGVLAVDLLEAGDRLLVSEVNPTMEFRNSIEVTGVDIPGRVAAYAVAVARGESAMVRAAS
jgi:[lysine-biosynthesis-protein LysW]--L-2-aminoadipate ligase